MNIWYIILIVMALGAFGGIVNCAIIGELALPQFDPSTNVWRAGWIGNVIVGGTAAVVVWGINGPLAAFDVIGGQLADMKLTVSQLLSSIVVGLGGGNILTQMSQKQAERIANESLAADLVSYFR